ncbi:DUF6770 family protein [Chryseobacterium sp.]|uniref:DUF6770 family protein n=1 Tax=Chryseobacterium sp. TaxID=1871047 RepID=UPI0011CA5832|nr:DUF6770 family protein [Chryseobacterium sp.]TXF77631.1 hypothetical protein FUA25_06795 [Chryseobacterium sp.]
MRKFFILFLCAFFSIQTYSQRVYPVFNSSGETFGYSSFSLVGKEANKEMSVQMELKDINLNKINDVVMKFARTTYNYSVVYNKKSVLILGWPYMGGLMPGNAQYYIYDLTANKLSERMSFPKAFDRTKYINRVKPVDDSGFLFVISNNKSDQIDLVAVDQSNKQLWASTLTNTVNGKKKDILFDELDVDNDLAVATYVDNEDGKRAQYGLVFINSKNGNELSRVLLDDASYRYQSNQLIMKNDKVYVFGDLYNEGKKFNGLNTGIFMVTTDRTGNNIVKKNLQWTDLKGKLDIDEKGWVEKTGYIYTHTFIIDDASGHILMPGEFFKGTLNGVNISDLVILDFNKDFDLQNVKNFDKKLTSFSMNSFKTGSSRKYGEFLNNAGYFDYQFHNKLDRNKGTVIYYLDVEKEMGMFSKGKYAYGTIAYINGEWSRDKINFTSKNPMGLLPSKPGYVMLYEEVQGSAPEMRIEKINY